MKYFQAADLGLGTPAVVVPTIKNIPKWLVNKGPAIVGGYLADWAYLATVERFHTKDSRWLPEMFGAVGVVVVSFGMEFLAHNYVTKNGHVFAQISDGMFGRMAKPIVNTLKRLVPFFGKPDPANADLSLDGDDEAMRSVAARIAASPDFLDVLTDGMVDVMRRNDVDLDDGAKPEMVRSMREVVREMARAA